MGDDKRSYPDWRDASAGDLALYALPYEPYYTVLPLLFWARSVVDGDDDEVLGLISYQGEIVPAYSLTPGELFGYIRGNFDPGIVSLLQQRVIEKGREMHRIAFPQPVAAVQAPLPESLSGESTRSRRRRQPASEETT